MSDSCFSCVVV